MSEEVVYSWGGFGFFYNGGSAIGGGGGDRCLSRVELEGDVDPSSGYHGSNFFLSE